MDELQSPGAYDAQQLLFSRYGYDRELARMIDAFVRDENDKASEYFMVESQHEILRSRFADEFIHKVRSYKNSQIFMASSKYSLKNTPWQPFKDMFYSFFKVSRPGNIREELFHYTRNLHLQEEIAMQNIYISSLFSSGEEQEQKTVPVSSNMIMDAFRLFFLSIAKKRKVILIFDEVQDYDEKSLELLDYLLRTLRKANIYFLMIQPEGGRFQPRSVPLNRITLKHLTRDQTELFLHRIFQKNLSAGFLNLIYEKSEGNPYSIKILLDYFRYEGCLDDSQEEIRFKQDPSKLYLYSPPHIILEKMDI
jgi:hypothetical protein